jgi:type I restriction enzyme M protein
MSEEQKKQLQIQLWNIANELRGKMDADEFRDYILGFIFYKYLSEKMHLYANNVLESDNLDYTDVKENTDDGKKILEVIKKEAIDKLGYFLSPSELFHELVVGSNNSSNIIEDLERILNNIEHSTMGTDSEDDFDKLFSELDLNANKLGKTVQARGELISKVLSHLDKIDFKLGDSRIDVLGDAYEYLISQFASGAGKKAGEFYTPQEVSEVLAKLVTVGKKHLKNVYDPTCGSGSLLLRVARYVDDVGFFYGQELNNTTYNLARMNMILHDVRYDRFNIAQEDTLEHPQHLDERFEAIVANPPFSAKWSASPLFMNDDRFSQYGKLIPSKPADYAFIQHMIYQLSENGTMAIVMPHGALYRGKVEKHIREYLIGEKNYLDAVIGLPINIFYQTDTPTCILVFKKCRKNPEDVLFIDASQGYEKLEKQNRLRQSDIDQIINAYNNRKNITKYAYVASLDEIKNNKYNISILRYVDTSLEDPFIDLDQTVSSLKLNADLVVETDKKLDVMCKELGVPTPCGGNLPLLRDYKKGLMQAIFSQKVRFRKMGSGIYSDWTSTKLKNVLKEHKRRNQDNSYDEVFSVAKNKGVINQIEHLGRSYSSDNISNYKVVLPNDIVYTKSPTSEFPFGIIKQNKLGRPGVVSVLYAVFQPENEHIGNLLDYYFSVPTNTYNYLIPLVNKGAKNTININNDEFLDGKAISLPSDPEEQFKISIFLSELDRKINLIEDSLGLTKKTKNSPEQELFA